MINYDLTKIKAVILDVDGVLSQATINMNAEGVPERTVNIKDGYILQLAVKLGYVVAIITGGNTEAIRRRYNNLGIAEIHLGSSVKMKVYLQLLEKYHLKNEEVIFMGDDIPDYEVMKTCGCPCCPKDAAWEIKDISCYISNKKGGHGCVRDVMEQLMRAQDKWILDKTAFGW
ncbi:MAG: HAD family hydrolase [Bacteroidaceae bacterium]